MGHDRDEPRSVRAPAHGAARERRNGECRPAARLRARRIRAHRRVRRGDRAVAAGIRAPARAHRRGVGTHGREVALRREPAPTGRAVSPGGHNELVGRDEAARGPRAVVPQLLRHRRGLEDRARSRVRTGVRDHQAREPVRRRPRRFARRRVPARARVRRAIRVRRDRRVESPDRHGDGRAHGGRAAHRRRHRARVRAGRDRGVAEEAQEHADPRGPGTRPRCFGLPANFRWFPRAGRTPLRVDAQRLARRYEGRADAGAVARPRAGLAHLRAREVERDRLGQGRAGRGHRRRPTEPGRVGGDRGQEGGGPCPRRCGRERRVLPVPRRGRGRGRRGGRGRYPTRGALRDEAVVERADELGLAMVFTGERHFLH